MKKKGALRSKPFWRFVRLSCPVAAGGGGGGGQLPPGAGTRGAPAKANKKKARPTKQRENNDSIQV